MESMDEMLKDGMGGMGGMGQQNDPNAQMEMMMKAAV
jgi:hypothetical protein